MADQGRFMEILTGLYEYAQGNGGVLAKSEVEESFAEMELKEEQYDLIYRYLFGKKITIQGIRIEPEKIQAESAGKKGDRTAEGDAGQGKAGVAGRTEEIGTGKEKREDSSEDSRYLKLYLSELSDLKSLAESERLALAMRLLSGGEEVMPELLEASLGEVVAIAKGYRGRGVHLEDLIQEGNIALMQVLKELCGKGQQEEPLAYIREYVRVAIAEYIDGQVADGDEQERIVAKLGLLHEAAKYMAKENGVLPDPQELADFAKLPVEEVKELVRLSKDAEFFGKDI